MKTFALFLTMICCASLAGCATNNIGGGAGYELLTPSASTARHIVTTDRPFAEQVAAHNRQCRQDDACRR